MSLLLGVFAPLLADFELWRHISPILFRVDPHVFLLSSKRTTRLDIFLEGSFFSNHCLAVKLVLTKQIYLIIINLRQERGIIFMNNSMEYDLGEMSELGFAGLEDC